MTRCTRRRFLEVGSGSLLAASLVGCDQLGDAVSSSPPDPLDRRSPFQPPNSVDINLVSHFLNRLSFGPPPGEYARVRSMGGSEEEAVETYLGEQLNPDGIDDSLCERAVRRFESLDDSIGGLFEYQRDFILEEISRATLLRAVYSRRQLKEVMVHFWTDHFNIDISKGDCKWLKAADDREVIRRHALSRFPDLLRSSALSPAMLWYLDGRENQKRNPTDRPNENYARELLELHTLGVSGGYTQRDVMEVARCLTGWTVRSEEAFGKGRVEFKADLHDDGEKWVLGHRMPPGLGEQDFDRVMEIVSLHPSTARYIATKLCRRFIADDPPAEAVSATARAFLDSAGDIPTTLRALFSTEGFRSSRGGKLKRPFRFIASVLRATGAKTDCGRPVLNFLMRMGHPPFQYPTPDGYPDEESPWLGTLLWRWNFVAALCENRIRGAHVDANRLREMAQGEDSQLMAHLLGRKPTLLEEEACRSTKLGPGLLLASPAFQRC